MIKKIRLGGKDIKYTLKTSKRARQMRLSVYHDGSFAVVRPYGLSESQIESFIREKADWVIKKVEHFSRFGSKPTPIGTRKHYLKHKERARCFILERIEHYANVYGYRYKRVSIRNQKTRWGSCSRDGNLNFNYKLLFLSKNVADYVIVHELCHLREFNHSRKFWDLISETTPNYKDLRKRLKTGK